MSIVVKLPLLTGRTVNNTNKVIIDKKKAITVLIDRFILSISHKQLLLTGLTCQ